MNSRTIHLKNVSDLVLFHFHNIVYWIEIYKTHKEWKANLVEDIQYSKEKKIESAAKVFPKIEIHYSDLVVTCHIYDISRVKKLDLKTANNL